MVWAEVVVKVTQFWCPVFLENLRWKTEKEISGWTKATRKTGDRDRR
jgi:hypothetical protein